MGPMRYALVVSLAATLIALLLPLAVFMHAMIRNPACVNLEVNPIRQVSPEEYEVVLAVNYCSSVPLKGFKVQLGAAEVLFGELVAGRVTREVTLSLKDLQSGVQRIEFRVAGLYRVVIELR